MSEKPAFPPDHRKRMYQGIAAWLMVAALAGAWVVYNAADTLAAYESRIPYASALVKNVYLTPQITEDTASPFGTTGGDGQPIHIALVMTGLGLSEAPTKRAIHDMPDAVALAFSPYAGGLAEWIAQARRRKHETIVLLPMESRAYPNEDSGPLTLLTRASQDENVLELSSILKDSQGADGTMNFMGSQFMSDVKNLSVIFRTLNRRNLFFIENPGAEPTLGAAVAEEAGMPYLAGDIVIDATATEKEIGQQLLALERAARKQGYAVGIASPYPVTFNMVRSWLETADRRGVRLVPLSHILKLKAERAPQQPEQQP